MSYNFHSYNNHTFEEAVELQLFMESLIGAGYKLNKSLSSYEIRIYQNGKETFTLNVPERSVSIS